MAAGSDPLTCALYADDLLIFGKASQQEATTISQTLEQFTAISGQQIGPSKSSIWFSKPTTDQDRVMVASILNVTLEARSLKYLGAPIAAN